jgi:hypothetical protein
LLLAEELADLRPDGYPLESPDDTPKL